MHLVNREIPLSAVSLTEREATGMLIMHRSQPLPRSWPSPISRFLDPTPAMGKPQPSAGHASTRSRGQGGAVCI